MSEEVEEQAALLFGSPLGDYLWSCDEYGAYIDILKRASK